MKSSSREGDSKLLGDQRKRQARTAGRDARAERGLSAVTADGKEQRRPQIHGLALRLGELERARSKPEASRRKEMTKIGAETNETEQRTEKQ